MIMMALDNSKTMQKGHEASYGCFQGDGIFYGPMTSFSSYLPKLKLLGEGKQANIDSESMRSMWEQYYYYWSNLYPNLLQESYCQPNPVDGWVYPSSHAPYFPTYWFPQLPAQMIPQSFQSEYGFQEFQYFVVIDFEATCDREKNPHPQEIIEFPSVIVNSRTGQLEDYFQVYVRPTHNQQLTEFCKDLTGIQQSQVDKGFPLSEALLAHDKWLEEKGVRHTDFAVVTWSNWDCQVMLESECRFKKISKPSYFNRWINLKVPFSEAFGGDRCNLKEAVKRAGLTWEGRAHCGLDDAKNTARLLTLIMRRGMKLAITNSLLWHSDNHPNGESSLPESGPAYYKGKNPPYSTAIPGMDGPLVYCYCGAASAKKVFRKPDQQKGSYFFSCGNCTNGPGCNFFKWAEDSEPVKVGP
ncbi:uncharacterized protein LOC141657791 [Silene latifolia]|uniref:uncharacterized protein LOC141657791 n=1 Tax=Silene latifolia TaxID=37657 RepID=UPI003D77688D